MSRWSRLLGLCLLGLLGLLAFGHSSAGAQQSDLDVLPEDVAGRMLQQYLRTCAHEALDRRAARFERLMTVEQIRARQEQLRAAFLESIGGLPAATPLKARTVGALQGRGYRIEKLIYESQPDFPVPALLYLPTTEPPYPAVLLPCGHSENGKAAGAYQRVGMLLARNGMACLCYDPIGQGERKQFLDPDGEVGGFAATSEHMLAGVAPILLGRSLATYRIWDGIRSLEYLASRPDIDARRLGCTGNSGGGLMTAYLMALDPRIRAAAPSCFITTTRRKNDSPGPGDAEQNLFGQIAYGMDHADYILMRAPRPALICAATRDFVPIEGTWEAFRECKRIYTRLGYPERVDLVEADATHGFSQPLREAAARWMTRWLLGAPAVIRETELPLHSDAELQCTVAGQVVREPDVRMLSELNQDYARELAARRAVLQESLRPADLRQQIAERLHVPPLAQMPPVPLRQVGEVDIDGLRIRKCVLESEPGIVLPALVFEPDGDPLALSVFVHADGKHVDAPPNVAIRQRVRDGHRVMAVDLRGYGETQVTPWRYGAMSRYVGPNAAEFFVAYMLGRSLVGMRCHDLIVAARSLRVASPELPLHLVAAGGATVPARHAAALAPELFRTIALRDGLASWESVVDQPITVQQLENTVHGALNVYDLPDLLTLCGDAEIRIESPRDAQGQRIVP